MRLSRILAAAAVGGIGYSLALAFARNRVKQFENIEVASVGAPGRVADVAGVRLHYVEQGTGEPVVLIHGLGGSAFSFRLTLPALAERFRAVAVDLKGFGYSDRPPGGDYSLTEQARLVLALMDRLGIERAAMIGHSMGGGVVMRVALAAPERVSRLVLVDSIGTPSEHQRSRLGFLIRPLLPFAAAALQGRPGIVERGLMTAAHDPGFITPEVVEGYSRPFRVRGALRSFETMLTTRTKDGELPLEEIRQPTLLLWGEQDRLLPPAQGEELASRIPDAQLQLVPDAGHLPLEERPDYCNQAILAFLAQPRNGSAPPAEQAQAGQH